MSHGVRNPDRESTSVRELPRAIRRIVGGLCVLTCVCFAPVATAEDAAPARKVALLVGVNRYLKPGFRDLQFAEADVVAVAAELRRLGFEVTLLLGSEPGERQATKANIEAAAQRMVAPLGKEDVALVMLSGHGQQLGSDPAVADLDKSQSYYCPVDAQVNRPETQVALSHLLDEILAPNVGRKILLVDACRDIPEDRTRGGRNTKGIEGRVVALPEDTAVFFSCRAGQMSFERHELGHGLFTYCVLEGLRREAASASGEITWARLVAHVNERMVSEELTRLMPPQLRQVPIPAGALPHTVLGRVTVQRGRPVDELDVDQVETTNAEVKGAKLAAFFEQFGIGVTDVTPETEVCIDRPARLYEGRAVVAVSLPNVLYQTGGGARPCSYTLRFRTPIDGLQFTRARLLAGPSGIIHPQWTITAHDASGRELGRASEEMIRSFVDVPAASFRITGPGIASLRIASDGGGIAAFSGVVIDDLRLTRGAAAADASPPTAPQPVPGVTRPPPTNAVSDPFAGVQAGDEWDSNGLRMKFCWCPPGTFTMGSPSSELGRENNEDQVQVTLSRGFWLGQTEVTREHWYVVMGTTPWTLRIGESGFAEGRPVTEVSWEDATEYCRRLTKREQDAGRLPTAAGATSCQPKPSGNTPAAPVRPPPTTAMGPAA